MRRGTGAILALELALLLAMVAAGCEGTGTPAGGEAERVVAAALEAQATAEAARERLQEAARQATAMARQAQSLAQQATVRAELTREARLATRQALELQATRQALEAQATRQALELQATASAQAFWAEATRTAWEATRQAEATAAARQLAPTATAQARAQAAAEQAFWWETHVVIPARALTAAAAGILVLALAAWAVLRVLDAVVLRIRVIRGKDGQIVVVMPGGELRALPHPDPSPPRLPVDRPPPPPGDGTPPGAPPVTRLEAPPPELQEVLRQARIMAAAEETEGEEGI